MIDPLTDELIDLRKAAKLMPGHGKDGRLSQATAYRYASDGIYGVRLETVAVGRCTYTTRAAVKEFVDAMTARANAELGDPVPGSRRRSKATTMTVLSPEHKARVEAAMEAATAALASPLRKAATV